MWTLCRERKFPPMGGEGWWDVNWPVFEQLWAANHNAVAGLDRAEVLEGLLAATREANTDPKHWPEVFG